MSETLDRRALWADTDWRALIDRIRAQDRNAEGELAALFSPGITLYLERRFDTKSARRLTAKALRMLTEAIRGAGAESPSQAACLLRGILAGFSFRRRRSREGSASEALAKELARRSEREREILSRYYLKGQPREVILGEMKATEAEFDLLRAKLRERFASSTPHSGRRESPAQPAKQAATA